MLVKALLLLYIYIYIYIGSADKFDNSYYGISSVDLFASYTVTIDNYYLRHLIWEKLLFAPLGAVDAEHLALGNPLGIALISLV